MPETTNMAHDIFLSYASEDSTVAEKVCDGLEAHGIKCWIASRNIRPGQKWPKVITAAINTSKVMVIIYSEYSNKSEHVEREVLLAAKNKAVIIPFRITDVTPDGLMEYYLCDKHWLDALTTDLDLPIKQLIKSIEAILHGRKDEEQKRQAAERQQQEEEQNQQQEELKRQEEERQLQAEAQQRQEAEKRKLEEERKQQVEAQRQREEEQKQQAAEKKRQEEARKQREEAQQRQAAEKQRQEESRQRQAEEKKQLEAVKQQRENERKRRKEEHQRQKEEQKRHKKEQKQSINQQEQQKKEQNRQAAPSNDKRKKVAVLSILLSMLGLAIIVAAVVLSVRYISKAPGAANSSGGPGQTEAENKTESNLDNKKQQPQTNDGSNKTPPVKPQAAVWLKNCLDEKNSDPVAAYINAQEAVQHEQNPPDLSACERRLYQLGSSAYEKESYSDAKRYLEAVASKSAISNNCDVHWMLAVLYQSDNNNTLALEQYKLVQKTEGYNIRKLCDAGPTQRMIDILTKRTGR